MKRRLLRGFVLRAFSCAVITALVASGASAPAAAEPAKPTIEVNRTPVGGAPPDRAWRAPGDASAMRTTCLNYNLGVLPWYPMERHQISDRLELLVNLDTRNVVLSYRELTIKGTGLNMSADRFYNAQTAYNWIHSGTEIGLEDPGFTNAKMRILHGPNGYCVEFPENEDGTFAPAKHFRASLTKTPEGGYVVTFNDSGERWLFTGKGWFVSQTDRNGNANTNRYRPDGSLASITDSQGRVTTFNRDAQGRDSSLTDPTGLTFGNYIYDDDLISELTDRAGNKVKFGYDTERDLLTSVTDGRGNIWKLEYETDSSQITKLSEPTRDGTGASTTYADDSVDRTKVTDPNLHSSVHEFESPGRQTKATDALGHTQSRTWTANSDVNVTTNGLQHSTTYDYDPQQNLIGTKLATGAKNVVGYTDSAHPHLPTQITDASGNQVTRHYDDNGNVTSIRSTGLNADLEVLTYTERMGLVESKTDGKQAKTTYEYDDRGNLTKVVPPAPAKPTTFTYDALSRIDSMTDGNGKKIVYSYDKLDRVTTITHNGTVLQSNAFDANGNLTRTQTADATRVFEYDPRNLLEKVTRGTEVVSYTYDKAGNVKTLTTPTGVAKYDYDEANRLKTLQDSYGGTTTFNYDNADRRTTTTFPGGAVQTTGYDNAGRQTSVTVTRPGGGELLKTTNRYTKPDGTDTDRIQVKTRGSSTRSFAYDGAGRLKTAPGTTYDYDNATNLLSGEGRTYTVNAADQATKANDTTVAFDGAGNHASTTNPESRYTFSPTNQVLTGHAGTTQVLDVRYDTSQQTQPRTITETAGGSQVTHVLTHTALGITETVDNGKRSSYTRDAEGLLIGLKDGAGARYGAVTDHQGSVIGLVDTSGNLVAEYDYTAYGTVTATGTAAAVNPFRYLGAYQLQLGTYFMGYRVYDSAFARFRSPDPTGQEPNPYNYAQGDPINNSDPTGASTGSTWGAAIGGLVGGVAVGALALSCPATAGAGCIAAGGVMSALGAGAGAGLGSSLGGGTPQEVRDDGLSAMAISGFTGGAKFVSGLKGLF
ncbi:RHS repeat-associated core domain-containing protein [Lentzea aerocolonigenes]|uniref:RHS repeat-associated core domain-containing protein n=1 Tax=Lentzea aerocolonigenes TaxID=68170 RepID=UPI0009DCA727|nr:RHS repeat-associated core domain-containing protein [Lentzea aerocolonigenes]MCP2242359.1 RHS repeat-associated core domain-containing protein [Lentzea aerocolonigenes]